MYNLVCTTGFWNNLYQVCSTSEELLCFKQFSLFKKTKV